MAVERKYKAMAFYFVNGVEADAGYIVRLYREVARNLTWAEAKQLRAWDKSVELVPQIG